MPNYAMLTTAAVLSAYVALAPGSILPEYFRLGSVKAEAQPLSTGDCKKDARAIISAIERWKKGNNSEYKSKIARGDKIYLDCFEGEFRFNFPQDLELSIIRTAKDIGVLVTRKKTDI